MTEEVATEPVVSEPVAEPTPTPELVAEPAQIEEIPTAQPVEPLSPEPIQAPEVAPEAEVSVPEFQSSAPVSAPVIAKPDSRSLFAKAREIIQFRKRKKLEKIMNLFLKQSTITNDNVEKFLHVSDATATRYLQQLEKEGKIMQTGRTGTGVSYSRM